MTRAERVAQQLKERELDGLLVTGLVNVRWLTGFTGSNGGAVVGRDGLRRFLTDFRYLTQSAEQVPDEWDREIGQDLIELAVQRLPAGRLGFDDAQMPVKQHARLAELVNGLNFERYPLFVAGLVYEVTDGVLDTFRGLAGLPDRGPLVEYALLGINP